MHLMNILLPLILFLLWNIFTVGFFILQVRKGKLTPLKYSLTFSFGFSSVISSIVFIAISMTEGVSLRSALFSLLVFLVLEVISFPLAYLFSKTFLKKLSSFRISRTHRHQDQ